MSPIGKRYLGRHYRQRAEAAWASGNQRKALSLINSAIHYDPLNRAAIDLRASIAQGQQYGDHPQLGPAPAYGEYFNDWRLYGAEAAAGD